MNAPKDTGVEAVLGCFFKKGLYGIPIYTKGVVMTVVFRQKLSVLLSLALLFLCTMPPLLDYSVASPTGEVRKSAAPFRGRIKRVFLIALAHRGMGQGCWQTPDVQVFTYEVERYGEGDLGIESEEGQ